MRTGYALKKYLHAAQVFLPCVALSFFSLVVVRQKYESVTGGEKIGFSGVFYTWRKVRRASGISFYPL
jgi:hypothetical protein